MTQGNSTTNENPHTGHAADCGCHQCCFEGPEVEPTEELIAKGWLKPTDPPLELVKHNFWDYLELADDEVVWHMPYIAAAGCITMLTGATGAGKTTLIHS